jgi:hypothetical protein
MTRWPIRIRLTAAFTVMMALILTGVAVGTVLYMRASLDESITATLQYRLRELQPVAATASPRLASGSRDTAEHSSTPTAESW